MNTKKWLAYPVTVVFFLFLFAYTLFDLVKPNQVFSEMENRELKQFPPFSIKELLENKYTPAYEDYVNDQFALRPHWIDLKSRAEFAFGKMENNNILYGADGYQFMKQFQVEESNVARNAEILRLFAEKHPGLVQVMVVPTSSLVLKEKLPAEAPFADENRLIDQLYTGIGTAAQALDIRPALQSAKDKYIYYRTDHHWTTTGAYEAYKVFATQNGKPIFDTAAHTAKEVPGFYGAYYSRSKFFATKPDTITYYEMPNQVTVEGEKVPLYNSEFFASPDKYAGFLHGNKPFLQIEGSGTGKLLVIKDSYANSFVPFLTGDYSQVDVVDLRAYAQSVEQLVQQEKYDRVLILYGFSTLHTDRLTLPKLIV